MSITAKRRAPKPAAPSARARRTCSAVVEPERAHGRDDPLRVLGLRPRACASTPASVAQLRQLGHAAADAVVHAPLVHGDRAQPGAARAPARRARRDVAGGGSGTPERGQQHGHVGAGDGNAAFRTGSHCSSPSSSTAHQPLDVQIAAAHLDRRVAAGGSRYSSSLSSLRVGVSAASTRLGGAEARAEAAPLPAPGTWSCCANLAVRGSGGRHPIPDDARITRGTGRIASVTVTAPAPAADRGADVARAVGRRRAGRARRRSARGLTSAEAAERVSSATGRTSSRRPRRSRACTRSCASTGTRCRSSCWARA